MAFLKKQEASPLREALAAAIKANAERQSRITTARTALETTRNALHAAFDQQVEAEAAVDAAKAGAVEYALATARGETMERPKTIREAHAALAVANDEVAALRATVEAMEAEVKDSERLISTPVENLARAAAAVLSASPEVHALLADVERLQAELVTKCLQLDFLRRAHVFPDQYIVVSSEQAAVQFGRRALQRIQMPVSAWPEYCEAGQSSPCTHPWAAALSALKTDATATLPG